MSERDQDGQPLQNAEARTRPLDADQREPQPRGVITRAGKRVDHAEAAKRFLAAPEHQSFMTSGCGPAHQA